MQLGLALKIQGKLRPSLEELQRGHELGSKQPGWSVPSEKWVADAERYLKLAEDLPELLRGELSVSAMERLAYAEVCRLLQRPADAARLYREELDREGASAELKGQYLVEGARAAALVGSTDGDAAEAAAWRAKALAWLREFLPRLEESIRAEAPERRRHARKVLWIVQQCPEFAGMRDAALARLPHDEQIAWEALWADVESRRQQAAGPPVELPQ